MVSTDMVVFGPLRPCVPIVRSGPERRCDANHRVTRHVLRWAGLARRLVRKPASQLTPGMRRLYFTIQPAEDLVKVALFGCEAERINALDA